MNIHKKTFISKYIPPSLHFNVNTGILHVYTKREREIVLLDIAPTPETLKTLSSQNHLPSNIVFEATSYAYPKNASGVQGKKEVVAMCIRTTEYRITSPYTPWFAAYPRAVTIYLAVVMILAITLYFLCA